MDVDIRQLVGDARARAERELGEGDAIPIAGDGVAVHVDVGGQGPWMVWRVPLEAPASPRGPQARHPVGLTFADAGRGMMWDHGAFEFRFETVSPAGKPTHVSPISPDGGSLLEWPRPLSANSPAGPPAEPESVAVRGAPRSRFCPGYWAVEVPVLLLLISTLVFRLRDAQALAANPLDQAAIFRVGCVGSALLLGWIALMLPGRSHLDDQGTRERLTSRPFRLFSLYVLVVFVGALTSVLPLLTAYRGVELATLLVVYAGARRAVGPAATRRIENTLYGWIIASLALVWMEALLFPQEAFVHITSPIPVQLQGVYPAISSNGVGGLGALLALWSLGRLGRGTEGPRSRLNVPLAVLGLLTLVAGQYRTGYVATMLGLVLLLALWKRLALSGLLLLSAALVALSGPLLLARAQPYILRGQSQQQASQLSGRLYFWELAIPVWKRSPLIGRGLITASRFEVLAPAGLGGTSTIHGTWIEALLGTGIIGVGLLGASVLVTWRRALVASFGQATRDRRVVPVLILTTLSVQSLTGSDFAVFGFGTLLYVAVALSLRDASPYHEPPGKGQKSTSLVGKSSPRWQTDIA